MDLLTSLGINVVIDGLNSTKGLHHALLIDKNEKNVMSNLEEPRNIGVKECLKRKFTLCVLHNSLFRKPVKKIVEQKNGGITFPPIPFPEVKAKNVVSSSPGARVDAYLRKNKYKDIEMTEQDATLLVGFDF